LIRYFPRHNEIPEDMQEFHYEMSYIEML
jgi:hypothetical protein